MIAFNVTSDVLVTLQGWLVHLHYLDIWRFDYSVVEIFVYLYLSIYFEISLSPDFTFIQKFLFVYVHNWAIYMHWVILINTILRINVNTEYLWIH